MQFTQSQFILTLTSLVLTVGMLCTFFVLLLVRHYRAVARQQRLLLQAMIDTEEEERRRIAEDMHDGLGQLLAGVKMRVGALERFNNLEMNSDVDSIKQGLDEGMVELRRAVRNLVPRRIEHDGLVAALGEMCAYMNDAHAGIRVTFRHDGTYSGLDRSTETCVYRIAQELVHNAVKHSNAATVHVSFSQTTFALLLSVEDNGKGFDLDRVHNGNGLRNLRNRVHLLKGTLRYEKAAPHGTLATIIVKIQPPYGQ